MNTDMRLQKIVMLVNDSTFAYNLRREVLQRLAFLGYDVVVACKFLNHVEGLKALGVRLINLNIGRRGKNPFDDMKLFAKMLNLLRTERPDLVLTNNIKSNIYGGMACRLLGIKYLPNITGLGTAVEYPGLMQKLTTFLYRLGIAGADCVFFQNRDNKEFFQKRGLLSKKTRVRLLPGSGVNIDRFLYTEYPLYEKEKVFTFIGRLMPDKGIKEYILAAKKIKKTDASIVFRCIGQIDDMDNDLLIDLLDTCEYIEFTSDVHPYIAESQVIVLPSYHEGTANVLLEAAAMGRPVIATNVPGCRETFDDGITGLGCQPRNVDSLANAMLRFIALPHEEKAAMGLAGRKKMEREFDRNIVVDAYMEEIEKACGGL